MRNKGKQPVPSEESETTENEFSEVDALPDIPVKGKGGKGGKNQKIRQTIDSKKLDVEPASAPQRNVPIDLKYKNLKVRTFWTIVMLLGFIGIIAAGHFYCAALVFLMGVGMVREILSLKRNREKDHEVQFSLALNWYFFAVAVFFFYGRLFSTVLTSFSLSNVYVYEVLVTYHEFITFTLWIAGFLMFTLSLKKGYLRYQFRQFGWTHISLLLIVGQGAAMINNIYEGIIWFILPCLLVISNDIFAYIFGIFYGKRRLIELSPKKTIEGFIGGMFSTIAFAFIFSSVLSHFQYLICPQHYLVIKPFQSLTCKPPTTFNFFAYRSIYLSEFQIHSMILALFASLVSPFGGFFASGFKRAIKVKDFADIIPGHGGITDRMDCQVLTGTFVYLYVRQIVNGRIIYGNRVLRFIMNEMDGTQQLLLFMQLQKMLLAKGALNSTLAVE